MFLSGHRLQFEKYWKNEPGERKETIELLLFSLIHLELKKHSRTNKLSSKINILEERRQSTQEELTEEKHAELEKEILDLCEELAQKNEVNNETVNKVVSAYLISFYHYHSLISDYKKNFENLSYWEFQKVELQEQWSRNQTLIENNVLYVTDLMRSLSAQFESWPPRGSGTTHLPYLKTVFNSTKPIEELFVKHKIDLNNFSESLSQVVEREKRKIKQKDPYLLNSFRFLLSDLDFISLDHALSHVETASFDDLVKKVNLLIEQNEIILPMVFPHSISKWHEALQNISASIIQYELTEEMRKQFDFRNYYSCGYYANSPKDLVKNFATIELSSNSPMDPKHLAKILSSKGINLTNPTKPFLEASVEKNTKQLPYFD